MSLWRHASSDFPLIFTKPTLRQAEIGKNFINEKSHWYGIMIDVAWCDEDRIFCKLDQFLQSQSWKWISKNCSVNLPMTIKWILSHGISGIVGGDRHTDQSSRFSFDRNYFVQGLKDGLTSKFTISIVLSALSISV